MKELLLVIANLLGLLLAFYGLKFARHAWGKSPDGPAHISAVKRPNKFVDGEEYLEFIIQNRSKLELTLKTVQMECDPRFIRSGVNKALKKISLEFVAERRSGQISRFNDNVKVFPLIISHNATKRLLAISKPVIRTLEKEFPGGGKIYGRTLAAFSSGLSKKSKRSICFNLDSTDIEVGQ